MLAGPRITELSNSLTSSIDEQDALGIVRLLRQSDAQLFTGFDRLPCLYDEETVSVVSFLAGELQSMLFDEDEKEYAVIFSGCGTSGRIACYCAEEYQNVVQLQIATDLHLNKNVRFHYLIAGGDDALIRSVENAEDDPVQAVVDIRRLCDPSSEAPSRPHKVLYIGITCGMSAPYVFGQLRYLASLQDPEFVTAALMGFNPFVAPQELEPVVVLNPAVGPEPITGSTRMKGGSASKILLDAIFVMALQRAISPIPIFQHFESAARRVYLSTTRLSAFVQAAGRALLSGGRVYYVGRGRYGVLGFVDASECTPTYGADFQDVRGCMEGGWKGLDEADLSQLPVLGPNDICFLLTPDLGDELERLRKFLLVEKKATKEQLLLVAVGVGSLAVSPAAMSVPAVVPVSFSLSSSTLLSSSSVAAGGAAGGLADLPVPLPLPLAICTGPEPASALLRRTSGDMLPPLPHRNRALLNPKHVLSRYANYLVVDGLDNTWCAELALKLILNAISTGAHVLRGMIFGNRMVNLRVSNQKLYFRAIHIIVYIMNVSNAVAEECLLQSLYLTEQRPMRSPQERRGDGETSVDPSAPTLFSVPVADHVQQAMTRQKAVPLALLLTTGKFTLTEAQDLLAKDPVVRRIVREHAA